MHPYLDTPLRRALGVALLLAVLGAPFALKLVTRLEPYPAIIMPAGAGKLERKGTVIRFISTGLYGIDAESGNLKRLNNAKFIEPIPRQYLWPIVQNDLGLNPELVVKIKSIKTLGWEFNYRNRGCLTPENIDRTKSWMRSRLTDQGCKPEKIMVREMAISVDATNAKVLKTEVLNEKTFNLF